MNWTSNKDRDPDADLKEEFENVEDYFAETEEEERNSEPPTYMKWMKKAMAAVLIAVLLGNVLAFWPRIYNLDVIQFLITSRELSKSDQIQIYKDAVVIVNASDGKGTGFNLSEEGYIITNQHIVEDDQTVVVSFPDIGNYSARVVAADDEKDLALLRLLEADKSLPMLKLEKRAASQLKPESPIYVIGNPLHFHHIANQGVFVGIRQGHAQQIPVLILDAPIYRGNSGSPVINKQGKVIGVVFATSHITLHDQREKVGLAVPAAYVKQMAEEVGLKLK